ncbi:MAG TPA: FAD-dependent monooxygenase [Croceibacterium sp.]|nr:FAD-dependent monooxygenase [Croceibacterium sp.]
MPPLILGAGPAGCAAAIALARGGAAPLLLDREAEASDQLCGGFLSWRTVAQLRELGVDPAALGARRVERLALFAGEREAALPLPATSYGLSRRALDDALRRRAVAAGARLACDSARGIDGLTVLGRRREWTGDALFLATGKHDVRGLARPRRSADPALGLRLRLPPTAERERRLAGRIELHAFDRGYAGIVLQEDGSANVCLAVRKSRLAAAGGEPAQLLEALAGRHRAFARRLARDWREQAIETVGAVPYGWIARETRPGLFRLGDQAAVIPSLAGEGISIALASGAAAARHWLERGAAAAAAYQREMATRAAAPVRAARIAWALAEHPLGAALGIALAERFPPLLRTLMRASRVAPEPALAQPGDAA